MGANVRYDCCCFSSTICLPLINDQNVDGLLEFAYAIGAASELQLGTECYLEETLGDFVVGKLRSLHTPANAHLGVLGYGWIDCAEEYQCPNGEKRSQA